VVIGFEGGFRVSGRQITDDLKLLLDVMPPAIERALTERLSGEPLIEVVLDLGRLPEARFPERGEDLSP